MTVADYPDFQTPQAHATQIAVTGVPLLRATNTLSSGAGDVLAGGASQQLLSSVSVNQPGYEFGISAYMAAGTGTVPFIALTLYFWDSATGLFANRRDVVVPVGNGPGNALASYIRGPMHGDMFRVDATNLDPAVAATIQWFANQTSHVYERDEARQFAYAGTAPNGYTNPTGIPTTNLIGHASPTIAASSSATYLFGLFSGDVFLDVINPSSTISAVVDLRDPSGYVTGAANSHIFNATVAPQTSLEVNLSLPFSPMTVQLTNNATSGTVTPSISIAGQDH